MKREWLLVALVIAIWGVTFASTRVLLADFSALEVLLLRFGIAYAALTLVRKSEGTLFRPAVRDEWIFASMGLTGIFAYQFLENCAIYYTNASNVAILVSFGPVVTAVLARLFSSDGRLSPMVVLGSVVAICGVALVSLSGMVEFRLRPLGDLMALCAMFSWGCYSILLDKANARGVPPQLAIRKAFGWALVMMAPFALWGMTEQGTCALDGSFAVILDGDVNAERFSNILDIFNIVFLGLLASAASFILWSAACRALGVVKTTISLYLTPIVGVVFASVFLGERVTLMEALGGCVILAGVALATKGRGNSR